MDEDSVRNLEETQSAVRESEFLVYCLGISPSQGPLTEGGPVVISGPGQNPSGGPTIPGGTGGPQGTPSTNPTIRLPGGVLIPIPGRRLQLVTQQQLQNPKGGGTNVSLSTSVDMNVLDSFADASGGRAWLVGGIISDARGNAIEKILDQLAEELRSQYSLGYYPQHKMDDRKWHHVEVRAKDPKYHVRARKDFFGG
jgi:VWFA-related protein